MKLIQVFSRFLIIVIALITIEFNFLKFIEEKKKIKRHKLIEYNRLCEKYEI